MPSIVSSGEKKINILLVAKMMTIKLNERKHIKKGNEVGRYITDDLKSSSDDFDESDKE